MHPSSLTIGVLLLAVAACASVAPQEEQETIYFFNGTVVNAPCSDKKASDMFGIPCDVLVPAVKFEGHDCSVGVAALNKDLGENDPHETLHDLCCQSCRKVFGTSERSQSSQAVSVTSREQVSARQQASAGKTDDDEASVLKSLVRRARVKKEQEAGFHESLQGKSPCKLKVKNGDNRYDDGSASGVVGGTGKRFKIYDGDDWLMAVADQSKIIQYQDTAEMSCGKGNSKCRLLKYTGTVVNAQEGGTQYWGKISCGRYVIGCKDRLRAQSGSYPTC